MSSTENHLKPGAIVWYDDYHVVRAKVIQVLADGRVLIKRKSWDPFESKLVIVQAHRLIPITTVAGQGFWWHGLEAPQGRNLGHAQRRLPRHPWWSLKPD